MLLTNKKQFIPRMNFFQQITIINVDRKYIHERLFICACVIVRFVATFFSKPRVIIIIITYSRYTEILRSFYFSNCQFSLSGYYIFSYWVTVSQAARRTRVISCFELREMTQLRVKKEEGRATKFFEIPSVLARNYESFAFDEKFASVDQKNR